MFHLFFSDARRKRPPPPSSPPRRRPGKEGENEYPGSADVSQEECPENAEQSIIAALTDQEDEPEEYDIHPKHAI